MGAVAADIGRTVAAGTAIAAAAFAALTVKALNLTGELEQNMGGAKAVFDNFAEDVYSKSTEAFSQMGLSASDYLATINKMGSLLKGAGYDSETAMNLSAAAMQRAADVASIMGIDTTAAMEAIAGAAKGNFTIKWSIVVNKRGERLPAVCAA